MPQEMLDIYSKFNALPYHGEAVDIGHTVVFLTSDESKFIWSNPSNRRWVLPC